MRMPYVRVVPLVALVLATSMVTSVAQPSGAPSPADIARRVQQHYTQVLDLEADFVQTYTGGLLRQSASERGTVAIRRPGRMRWTYTAPERKEFIADGHSVYAYVPADRQVIISPMPGPHETTPALFLSGQGHLVDDFRASPAELPAGIAGLLGVTLTPNVSDRDLEWITLGVDATTWRIHYLSARDRQGGTSTFRFSRIREDRRLPDQTYQFTMPKGVDVIRHAATH